MDSDARTYSHPMSSQDCDEGLLNSSDGSGRRCKHRFESQDMFVVQSMRKVQEGPRLLTSKLTFSQHPQLPAATGVESS